MVRIRLKRIILIITLLCVRNFFLLVVVLNSPYLQSLIAKSIIDFFSDTYNLNLTIGKLELSLPRSIHLSDVVLQDSIGDTLLSSKSINLLVGKYKFRKNELFIENIKFNQPHINFFVDSLGNSNYKPLLSKFISNTDEEDKDTSKFTMLIHCNNFNIDSAYFSYCDTRYCKKIKEEVFDPYNFTISDFNLDFSNIDYLSDTISLSINDISFNASKIFSLKKFSTRVHYCETGFKLDSLIIKSRYSFISCPSISVEGTDSSYLSDFINKTKLNLDIDTLIVCASDLSFFQPLYKYNYNKLHLSGSFTGRLSKFKLKNFNLAYGEDTRLQANLSVDGLPDFDLALMFGDINNLSTSYSDINNLLKTITPLSPIVLPSILKDVGKLSFTGKITGLINDLVAYGVFRTNIGTIKTDIALVTDFKTFYTKYKGKIAGYDIDIGSLLKDKKTFGTLNFTTNAQGTLDSLANFRAKVDCQISSISILNYNYKNININGDFSNNSAAADILINDPNLQFEFIGKYSNNKDEHFINFTADCQANLSNLKLLDDSTHSELKFLISSDLSGDMKSIPQGSINLSNCSFKLNNNILPLNKLNLTSSITNKQQLVNIFSDYLNANISGSYSYQDLYNSTYNMLTNYLPSLFSKHELKQIEKENKILFNFDFRNIDQITSFINQPLKVPHNMNLKGNIDATQQSLDIKISVPQILYDSIEISEFHCDIIGNNKDLNLGFDCKKVSSSDFPWVENFYTSIELENDSLVLKSIWDNYDSLRNSGDIKISTKFISVPGHKFPRVENLIHKSVVTTSNNNWIISRTPIIIDSTDISIDKFSLTYSDQVLQIDGKISEDPSQLLRCMISKVNLNNFNVFLRNTGYQLEGLTSGNARVANLYSDPSFKSSFSIAGFKINEEDFGRFELSANWEAIKKSFSFDGINKYMKFKANYSPKTDSISANCLIDNLKLNLLNNYLKEYGLSELDGAIDISINAQGTLANPDLNGYINFKKAVLMYDMLRLKIYTDDKVHITKNAIQFNNFKVFDENKNTGIINGLLRHNNFSDISYKFNVIANNLKVLNTTAKDNSTYYGTAYATGNVRLEGDLNKLEIDVKAKTMPKTKFVLPMTSTYESNKISYLSFAQRNITNSNSKTLVKNNDSDFTLDFKMDIEVTPDAEAQIVFDPKVGDIIKGYCSGNLKMEYNADEEFLMYGDLIVNDGDYLFTLENIINKKFHIQQGGTISWTGSPYNAQIDLDAKYLTKAPLSDLMWEVADSSDIYKKPVNVECKMHMSGILLSPDILFSINLINAPDKAKAQLSNLTQDEINKQLLYLLIMNRFYANNQNTNAIEMGSTTNAVGVTSAELLSNQLNNWLSQLSKDFDIGFNYRPGTDLTGKELEVAMSTQIINDRVLINGNVGIGQKKSSSSSFIGDIEVQLKVNKSGSFRIKGFTRANDELQAEYGPFTSGAGLFYTNDFNNFRDFFTNIWHNLTFKDWRDKKKKNNNDID